MVSLAAMPERKLVHAGKPLKRLRARQGTENQTDKTDVQTDGQTDIQVFLFPDSTDGVTPSQRLCVPFDQF